MLNFEIGDKPVLPVRLIKCRLLTQVDNRTFAPCLVERSKLARQCDVRAFSGRGVGGLGPLFLEDE